jgi:hypothetical protein
VEDFHPAVAPIEHVIDSPALDRPRCSWHRQRLAETAGKINIMNVPFSSSGKINIMNVPFSSSFECPLFFVRLGSPRRKAFYGLLRIWRRFGITFSASSNY